MLGNLSLGLCSLQLWSMFLFSSSTEGYYIGCCKLTIIYWRVSIAQVLCYLYRHHLLFIPSLPPNPLNPMFLCLLREKQQMCDHLWPLATALVKDTTRIQTQEESKTKATFKTITIFHSLLLCSVDRQRKSP